MSTAHVLIRQQPNYRSDAFCAGLAKRGYKVKMVTQVNRPDVKEGDVIVTWNAYGSRGAARDIGDMVGARTLVVENGYIGKDHKGWQYYAIAEHGHCGSGRWRFGGPGRWENLKTTLPSMKPWREDGKHVLICGQRGIGEPKMKSPQGWEDDAANRLKKMTKRPLVIRRHPGRHKEVTDSLESQLENAWAVVVWSSNCSTTALMNGIPVFYDAPYIASQGAAEPLKGGDIEKPKYPDRDRFFGYLAAAQWQVKEIEKGEPFRMFFEDDIPNHYWVGGYKAKRYW